MKLTLLATLTLALFAQAPKGPTLPPAPVTPAPAPAPAKPAAAKPPPAPPTPPTDPVTICRASCDRTYYVCLAGEDAETCPSNWLLCRKSCATPRG